MIYLHFEDRRISLKTIFLVLLPGYLHFEDRRISLKIIFLVLLPVGSRSLLGLASIHVVERETPLDKGNI